MASFQKDLRLRRRITNYFLFLQSVAAFSSKFHWNFLCEMIYGNQWNFLCHAKTEIIMFFMLAFFKMSWRWASIPNCDWALLFLNVMGLLVILASFTFWNIYRYVKWHHLWVINYYVKWIVQCYVPYRCKEKHF